MPMRDFDYGDGCRLMVSRLSSSIFCLLLFAVLGGCAVRDAAPPVAAQAAAPSLDIGTQWVAFAVDGVTEIVRPKPTLKWVGVDQIAGSGGCNGFAGRAVQVQDRLRIGPLAPAGKPCLTLPGEQEDLFFKALEMTRKVWLDGDQLVLLDDAGVQLVRFIRIN
jgi:heat shock protein HslJ